MSKRRRLKGVAAAKHKMSHSADIFVHSFNNKSQIHSRNIRTK